MRIAVNKCKRPCPTGRTPARRAWTVWLLGLCLASPTWVRPTPEARAQDRPPTPEKASVPLAEIEATPAPPPLPARTLADAPRIRDLYEQAREQLEDADARSALASLDTALNVADGDYYELHYLLAQAKFRLGRLGEARAAAEFAARLRHGAADVHYLLGVLYQQQDRREQATAHFRTATLAAQREVNNPRVTAAWYQLGRCLNAQGYLRAAAEAYQQCDEALWDTHPEHRNAEEIRPLLTAYPRGLIEQRLEFLRQANRMDEAVSSAAWAAEGRPEDVFLARLYGRVLLEAGQARRAYEYSQARLKQENVCGLLPLAAQAARAADRAADWVADLEKNIATESGFELATAVAQHLSTAGAHAEAARLWRALLNERPESANAAWALATAQRAAGDLVQAFQALTAFVREHPTSCDVSQRRLKEWLGTLETADQTLAFITERSAAEPRDFATDFVLGTLAAAAGQPALAEKLFRASLDARSDLIIARLARGHMLLSLYRWEPAKEQAAAALEVNPDLAAAHFIMAQAQAGLDQNDAAEESYKAAVNLAENDPACAAAFGQLQRRLGNILGAQRYFQQALSIDPAHAQAVEGLIESYVGDEKIELARVQLEQAEQLDVPFDVLWRCRTQVRFGQAPFREAHLRELAGRFEKFPKDVQTGLLLAAGLLARERFDEALDVAQQVRAVAPDEYGLLNLLARVRLPRLEYAEAIQVLRTLADRYPNRQNALALLADTYSRDFRIAEARDTWRRVLALVVSEGARGFYREQLLRTFTDFSEFDEALVLLGEWRRQDPDDDGLLRTELTLLSQAGRHSEAVKSALAHLERTWDRWLPVLLQPAGDQHAARESLEKVASAYLVCAEAARGAGDLPEVEQRLRAWLERYPDDPVLTDWLIQVLLDDERPAEALHVIGDFRPQTREAAIGARIRRGECLAAAKRLDEGLAEFDALLNDRVVRSDPGSLESVRERIVTALLRAEQYDQALKRCAEWKAQLPERPSDARRNLLLLERAVLQAAGRIEQSTHVMEALLEYAPNYPGLNNDLGYTWADAGRNLERATEMIRKAVAAEPLNPAYLDSLGWAYYKAGDFAAARKYLARSVRLRLGQSPVVYDHLGDTAYRLGDHADARQHWQKALELLDEESSEQTPSDQADLTAGIRAKMSALEQSEPPFVAPTAAEQN